MHFLLNIFLQYGYIAVFIALLLSGLGLPIPEDISLVTAGIIAGLGHGNVFIMLAIGIVGVAIGDSCIYSLGHIYGYRALENRFIKKHITMKRMRHVDQKIAKYGSYVIFIARFLPGLRVLIYLVTSARRKMNYLKFIAIDISATMISVPIWILCGYFGAKNIPLLLREVDRFKLYFFLGLLVIIGFSVTFYIFHLKNRRKKCKSRL